MNRYADDVSRCVQTGQQSRESHKGVAVHTCEHRFNFDKAPSHKQDSEMNEFVGA